MARGNIEERNGAYRVRVYVGMRDGKRRYATKTVHGTRREAEAALAELQHRVNTNQAGAPSKETVAAFLDEWFETASTVLMPSTIVTTRPIIKRLMAGLGHHRLTALSVAQIDQFYRALRRQGLSPATIRRIHGVLHSSLEVARRWGRITVNPATDARPGAVPRRAINPVTPTEVSQVTSAPGILPEMARFLRLAAATGMRPGEICGIQLADVDVELGKISIRRRVVRGDTLTFVDSTKNGRPRTISVGEETRQVLVQQVIFMQAMAQNFGTSLSPTSFLFSDDPGHARPWDPGMASGRFRKVARSMGITKRLYDL